MSTENEYDENALIVATLLAKTKLLKLVTILCFSLNLKIRKQILWPITSILQLQEVRAHYELHYYQQW